MDKLKKNYDRLCKLKVAKFDAVDPKTLTKFETFINNAQPTDAAGRAQKRLLLELCWNKNLAKKIIADRPHLVLWMSASEIQKFLSIKEFALHWIGSKYNIRYIYPECC